MNILNKKSIVLLLVIFVAGFTPLANAVGTLEFQFDGSQTVYIVGSGFADDEDIDFALACGDQAMTVAIVGTRPSSWITPMTATDAWADSFGWAGEPSGYIQGLWSCFFEAGTVTNNGVLCTLTATELGDFGVAMRDWSSTWLENLYGTAVQGSPTYSLFFDGGYTVSFVGLYTPDPPVTEIFTLLYGGVDAEDDPTLVYPGEGSSVVLDGGDLDTWGATVGWPAGYCLGAWEVTLDDTTAPLTVQDGTLLTLDLQSGDFNVAVLNVPEANIVDTLSGTSVAQPAQPALSFEFDGFQTVSIVGSGFGPTDDVTFALACGDQVMTETIVQGNPSSWMTPMNPTDAWAPSFGWAGEPSGYIQGLWSCAFYHSATETVNGVLCTLTATEVGDFGVAMRDWSQTWLLNYYGTAVQPKVVFVTVVDPPMDVNEQGETTETYTIHLGAQPSANVTITATRSSDDITLDVGGGPLASVDLIFTTTNYGTPQTITVKAVDDALSEGPETVTITHVASGGDAEYNALSIDSAEVAVTDNEAYCGQSGQPYRDGDIGGEGGCGDEYRDCRVNFFDFACVADEWLDCTDRSLAGCVQW